jgi:hypothetical protein
MVVSSVGRVRDDDLMGGTVGGSIAAGAATALIAVAVPGRAAADRAVTLDDRRLDD